MYHVALAKLSTAWLITICFGFISYNLAESMLIVFVYGGGKTWEVSGLSIAYHMVPYDLYNYDRYHANQSDLV